VVASFVRYKLFESIRFVTTSLSLYFSESLSGERETYHLVEIGGSLYSLKAYFMVIILQRVGRKRTFKRIIFDESTEYLVF